MIQQMVDLCGYDKNLIPNEIKRYVYHERRLSLNRLLPDVDQGTINLLTKMLSIDPKVRPAARELLKHPIFH